MVQRFCSRPHWNDFCSAPEENQTLSADKEQAGLRSGAIYVGGRNVNHSGGQEIQSTVSFVCLISCRHGGDMIQIAVAILKQMN